MADEPLPIFSQIGKHRPLPGDQAVYVELGTDEGNGFRFCIDAKIVPPLIVVLSAAMVELAPSNGTDGLIEATAINPKSTRFAVSKTGPGLLFDMGGFHLGLAMSDKAVGVLHQQLGQYLQRQ